MNTRLKSALLWGVVGALAFLVLIQGHELVSDQTVTVPAKTIATATAAVTSTVVTYFTERRFGPSRRSDTAEENETS